jgi:hypothetical protein
MPVLLSVVTIGTVKLHAENVRGAKDAESYLEFRLGTSGQTGLGLGSKIPTHGFQLDVETHHEPGSNTASAL